MTNSKLDEIDLKILNILQSEGRIQLNELAQKVSMSRTPVSLRVEKMVRTGVIRHFVTLVDRVKAGRPVLVITHVQLEKQTAALLAEFEDWVNGLHEVQCCLHVSGDWNFILHVTADTPQAYYQFLMGKINSLPNVAHTDSCFVLNEAKVFSPIVFRQNA